jgi:hypothetical protein
VSDFNDAINGLHDLLARELAPAQVIDGPATIGVSGPVVWVGITPDDPSTDVPTVTAGLRAERESFDIQCLARSWSGSADVRRQREQTAALVAKARAALRSDSTLGRSVMHARFGGLLYAPYYTEQAQLVVDVQFRVSCDLYR